MRRTNLNSNMFISYILHFLALALPTVAIPTGKACPIVFDGRIPKNFTLKDFDSADSSPYRPDFVYGASQ